MLALDSIDSSYDGIALLKALTLDIAKGRVVCLLGASGSGKTTLLRIIAGLQTPDRGKIFFDGQDITNMPVHERRFGLMFQDHALFPHLNVADNVSFGLKMQGHARHEQASRIRELLTLVNLVDYEKRDVNSLSGGERQRVALARSLAPSPRLLMLDEPLASLDASLRQQIVIDLHGIIRKLSLTTLYVTHDQAEAFALADEIAVLNQGHLEQIATPHVLYHQPKTRYVARFLGLHNIFRSGDLHALIQAEHRLAGASWLLIHPTGISLTHEGDGIPVTLTHLTYQGANYHINVETVEGITLQFIVPAQQSFSIGEALTIKITPSAIIPLEG